MYERILLMGPAGCGKSTQVINVCKYLQKFKKSMYVIDLEDKMEATLGGELPSNMKLYPVFEWTESKSKVSAGGMNEVTDEILSKVGIDDWIVIDRMDLAWPLVQRWYVKTRYNEDLAERMMNGAVAMGEKKSMMMPRVDQGSWQVINEQYDSVISKLLYKSRCNIIMTTGIKSGDDSSPFDIYGNVSVAPRGQKEIAHQPHSAFLLGQKKERDRGSYNMVWNITTAKDLPNRIYFDNDPITNFAEEYLDMYYSPKEIR